jgi:hypothetical protein
VLCYTVPHAPYSGFHASRTLKLNTLARVGQVAAAVEKAMADLHKQRKVKAAAEARAKHAEQLALTARAKVLYDLSRKRANAVAAARRVSSPSRWWRIHHPTSLSPHDTQG